MKRVCDFAVAASVLCLNTAQPGAQDIPASANPFADVSTGVVERKKPSADEGLGVSVRFLDRLNGLRNSKVKTSMDGLAPVLEGFSTDLGEGRIEASGRIKYSDPDGPQRLKAVFTNVSLRDVADLLGEELDVDVEGRISGEVDADWTGLTRESLAASLAGTGSFTLQSGAISNWKALERLAERTGIASLQSLNKVTGRVEVTVDNGIVRFTTFRLENPQSRFQATGGIRLRDEKMKARLSLSVLPELLAESRRDEIRLLGRGLRGQSNERLVAIPIPVAIEGDVREPKVKLDPKEKDIERALPLAASLLEEFQKKN